MNLGEISGGTLGTPLESLEALRSALAGVPVSSRADEAVSEEDQISAAGNPGASMGTHAGAFSLLAGGPGLLAYHDAQTKPLHEAAAKLAHEIAAVHQEMAYFRHVVDFQNLKIDKLTLLLLDLLHNKDVAPIVTQLQSLQARDPFDVDGSEEPLEVRGGVQAVHEAVNEAVNDAVHDSVHVHDQGHSQSHSRSHNPGMGTHNTVHNGAPNTAHNSLLASTGLDGNMDPQLHHVAQAAVQAQTKTGPHKRVKRPFAKVNHDRNGAQLTDPETVELARDKNFQVLHQHIRGQLQGHQQKSQGQLLRQHPSSTQHIQHQNSQGSHNPNIQQPPSHAHPDQRLAERESLQEHVDEDQALSVVDMPGLEVVSLNGMNGRKKPKVTVDFLHNPMTVKEIYDEFTVGFRGQPPLREMDERYGRHEWRGDSRSKELKRFQRRKKLCDAIERGMQKYGKTAEEIQAFIEDFRGDKSLTWVMNGNLPSDLLE